MRNRELVWIAVSLTIVLTSSCTFVSFAEAFYRSQTPTIAPKAMPFDLHYLDIFSSDNVTKNNTLCGRAALEAPYSVAIKWLRSALEQGIESADRERIHEIMTRAESVRSNDPHVAKAVHCLWSEAAYAIDILDGTRYLIRDEGLSWQVRSADGKSLVNPIDFTINDKSFYVLDSGTIYQGHTSSSVKSEAVLTVTAILTPEATIDGYLVQEITAIAVQENDESIVALDKSNDIYYYEGRSRAWHLLSSDGVDDDAYAPQYIDVEFGRDALYFLDVAGNRVWLQRWQKQGKGTTAAKIYWEDQALREGIRLTNKNDTMFVLLRNGQIMVRDNNVTVALAIPTAQDNSHVIGLEKVQAAPVEIFVEANSDTIWVVDRGARRIVAMDRNGGSVIGQVMAPEWGYFDHLQGAQVQDGWLYLMVKGRLLRLAEPQWSSIETRNMQGILPTWVAVTDLVLDGYGNRKPNDPRVTASLRLLSFVMPIAGAKLPSRMSLYPGARRAYRYGIHRGLDFFGEDSNVPIMIGTPVRAVANGVVKRADVEYHEMSADELAGRLEEAQKQHGTPASTLEKLEGRQIWIDHGNGLWTKYSHLDSIAPHINVGKQVKAGEVIGFVGVSGTSDGVSGSTSGAHLHFEIWVGNEPSYYVGQWLTVNETQQIYAAIFAASNALAMSHNVYSAELALGPAWDTFTPQTPCKADHYWLELPFSVRYNQKYSPRYPFGSTAGGLYRPHHGIDISNPTGTPVLAMAKGKVVHAGPDNPDLLGLFNDFYGNSVVIRLDRRLSTEDGKLDVYILFGHLDRVDVEDGQYVRTGDTVGTVGMTGIALGPHLHVEVRVGENKYENAVNPDLWIRPTAGTGNLAVRVLSADGQSWDGAMLNLYFASKKRGNLVRSFETYRGEEILGGDPAWGENGVISNLQVGDYYLLANVNEEDIEQKITVKEGQTTFLEIRTKK